METLNLNYSDLGVLLVISFAVYYALDALNYQKFLKGSKVPNARLLHVFLVLAISALVFLYYLFIKLALLGGF